MPRRSFQAMDVPFFLLRWGRLPDAPAAGRNAIHPVSSMTYYYFRFFLAIPDDQIHSCPSLSAHAQGKVGRSSKARVQLDRLQVRGGHGSHGGRTNELPAHPNILPAGRAPRTQRCCSWAQGVWVSAGAYIYICTAVVTQPRFTLPAAAGPLLCKPVWLRQLTRAVSLEVHASSSALGRVLARRPLLGPGTNPTHGGMIFARLRMSPVALSPCAPGDLCSMLCGSVIQRALVGGANLDVHVLGLSTAHMAGCAPPKISALP